MGMAVGFVDVIVVVGTAEVRGLGVVTKVGIWGLAGMAVGSKEVNDFDVMGLRRS
jgi:hypothetical protein